MTNNIAIGTTLKSGIVDIRDFLGSARKRKLSVAVAPGNTQQWYHSQSGWNNINNLSVQLNSAGTQLTINCGEQFESEHQNDSPHYGFKSGNQSHR
jgi:hypothetical protein